ncbi:MAG: exonuclease SbcCD subunit D [Ilumatobacteraceae bacterium]
MRILHTSDWHLGRSFGPVSLLDYQQQFIDWLVEQSVAEKVDLVVIAGDIFDRAIAPTEAVVMFRDAVRRLREGGARVVAITGNHDGADRVAAYDTLLDLSGVIVRGGYHNIGEVIPFDAADGRIDLVLLPFLDPQAAPDSLAANDADESADAADAASDDGAEGLHRRRMRRTHHSVLAAAIGATAGRLAAPRSLAVSHAFVAGGDASDSERQLSVGGTSTVEAALFHHFSYTALGHLHRPQAVDGRSTLRYSGTPLAYSFSETHGKSVSLIDMQADGTCVVHELPVPVGRPVRTITGTMATLLAEGSPETAAAFVRAIVTDSGAVLDAKHRLSAVYPNVVEIILQPSIAEGGAAVAAVDRRSWLPTETADEFWRASTGAEPPDAQRAILHSAIAAGVAAADGGVA